MTEFAADLHCHSTCSDGTMTPNEIVDLAVELGLSGLSITDHDTTAAYPAVFEYAKEKGLRMIPGVEFSSYHKNQSVHILGYAYKINHPAIIDLTKRHINRRVERNLKILKLLSDKGMPISPEEIDNSNHTVGRPHIAAAMVKHGFVNSIPEAFYKYIGDNKPCHAKGSPISSEETVKIIKEAGGIAIIAHPHLAKNRPLIDSLLTLPFDGIESHYARFKQQDNKPWIKIAERKGWIQTGGSDFHGTVKPSNPLGASSVTEETFNYLFEHYQNHHEFPL